MISEFYKCIDEWADRCRQKDKEIDALHAKVREYHEKYVHQDLLLTEQDKVHKLENEINEIKELLGCHRAYITHTIRDLTERAEAVPTADQYRQLEMKVRELEEQVRVATVINHAFKESEENLEAKLRQVEGEREQLGAALRVTVKWMQWWIDQRECDCENGTHSCGLRERINELSQAKRALEGKD